MNGTVDVNNMPQAKPLITVVIATFNSEKLLPMVVGALRKQSYPQDAIEILAVDGGSKDRTKEIARSMGCQVVDNPMTEPVHAKYLGFKAARGKYLMYLDHDEELVNPLALDEVVSTFQQFPSVKTVDSSGYINPPGYSLVNEYINDFGEPFSFFMYRQSRNHGFHLSAVAGRARLAAEGREALVFSASPANKQLFIENLAAGVVTDLDFVRAHVTIDRPQDLCHLFFTLNDLGQSFAVAKNNPLRHYSGDNWEKFLTKIEWRIKNNVYHLDGVGAAGFHGRQDHQPFGVRIKKFLFLPYAASLLLPAIDGIWLAATRKKWLYLMHPVLTGYTAWQICRHMSLKLLGYRPQMTSYDGKSTIREK